MNGAPRGRFHRLVPSPRYFAIGLSRVSNTGGVMNKKRVAGLSAALLLVLVVTGSFGGQQSPTNSVSREPVEYGPAKGTLVIVGGRHDQ